MNVATIVPRTVRPISVDASVGDAAAALTAGSTSAAPVIDRWGRVVGLVSSREILRALLCHTTAEARHRRLTESTVLEVMNAWPSTISPQDDVLDVARAMLSGDEPGLIVVEGGRLMGLITETDLVRALAAEPSIRLPAVAA